MAGLEAVREDDFSTLSLVQLLFFCGAVGVDVWTSVWLTAKEESVWMNGSVTHVAVLRLCVDINSCYRDGNFVRNSICLLSGYLYFIFPMFSVKKFFFNKKNSEFYKIILTLSR